MRRSMRSMRGKVVLLTPEIVPFPEPTRPVFRRIAST